MAPSIHLELDPGPWEDSRYENYRVLGQNVSGNVVVWCDEPITCRSVRVRVAWHTEGRGDKDEEMTCEDRLFEGELLPGEHRYRFETTLPDHPMSYAGRYINVVWTVKAWIDLAWKVDPKVEVPFTAVLP